MEQLLKLKEVCAMLGVSGPTVGKLGRDGKLPHIRIGAWPKGHRRWRREDVKAFVDQQGKPQEDMTA